VTAAFRTVHVRINDAATGQPTPARVRFAGPGGDYFAPFGRLRRFATRTGEDVGGNLALDAKEYAYIDGSCEIRLPAGPITVEVHKGFEYTPLHREVTLGAGQISLRLALERWTNLREQGWYAGDCRAHFLTPHAALLEGAAEDLAVVNLLAAENDHPGPNGSPVLSIPNILAFSGQRPALEMPGHLVAVNTHNHHPVLGSLGLLNCHRVVYPLRFGGPDGLDDWTLTDWCDQCHRKGGLVVWTRTARPGSERYDALLADLVFGKVDALEAGPNVAYWYCLLNCGFRVPLAAGSGKDSNQVALGGWRTYARLQPGEEFTYKNWIEAVRAGRTFATSGPLVWLTVAGQGPGAVLPWPDSHQRIPVRAEASSVTPFDRLEVVANGVVVADAPGAGSPMTAVVETDVSLPASGWLAARCTNPGSAAADGPVLAHTSPVYAQVRDRPVQAPADAVAELVGQLDRLLGWTEEKGRFTTDRQREQLAEAFGSARREILRRASGLAV
jgi:hypothetical protein